MQSQVYLQEGGRRKLDKDKIGGGTMTWRPRLEGGGHKPRNAGQPPEARRGEGWILSLGPAGTFRSAQ